MLRHVEALEAGEREERGRALALLQLAEPRLHVAAEVDNLQVRVLAQDLGLAAQRGRADDGAGGELREVLCHRGDEDVAHVLAGEVAGQDGALREVGGDVLGWVGGWVGRLSARTEAMIQGNMRPHAPPLAPLPTFIECTAMSMRPSSSASSISRVKSPLPPMSASGTLRILSPVVLMITISRAPSSASSEKLAFGVGVGAGGVGWGGVEVGTC